MSRPTAWITRSHYRPPLIVAAICFGVQAWSLLDTTTVSEIWPHDVRLFWPLAFAAAALTSSVAAARPDQRCRYIAACTIVAVEMTRGTAIFAEYGPTVSHIVARHVLVAFLAAYLLLDDDS